MTSHIKFSFIGTTRATNELLIALLQDQGFEGFEEIDEKLLAYAHSTAFNKEETVKLARQFDLDYAIDEIPETNWNKVWESNFQPVIVDEFCSIRADFHEPADKVQYDIVITPKMSFGTGHHATTSMMIRQMRSIDFTGKKVLDFGTGTGVLAILAAKMGAAEILAIDNDDWSIENTKENTAKNNVGAIEIRQGDSAAGDILYDTILANITRNVILDNLSYFAGGLQKGGILLLSGLLKEDEKEMISYCATHGLRYENTVHQDNWICLRLKK